MGEACPIPVRGYLIHITHYDPVWWNNKDREEPFDLGVGCEIVDAAADAGLNMLVIDLADGVVYRSHPELKRHYSVPMSHVEKLAARAKEKGLEVVPKLNFSKSAHHRHNDWFRPHHELDDTDEYWEKAFELVGEAVEACGPDRFFFIGMDEDTDRPDAKYAAAVRRLQAGLAGRGLRAAMWNDTPHLSSSMFQCVRKTLAAEESAPRDVVQVVWDYGHVRERAIGRIRDIRRKGFDAWIAPGGDPESVRAWRQVAIEQGCKGMLMTMWRPVGASTRKDMLDRIRALAPIYSSAEKSGRAVAAEGTRIAKAPRAEAAGKRQGRSGSVRAPNHLKRPVAKAEYLLPPNVYVRNWMVLGPFPFKPGKYSGKQQQDSVDDASFLSGTEADLSAGEEGAMESGVAWRRYAPAAGAEFPQVVDLSRMYGGMEHAVAYLAADIHSPKDVQDCRLCIGSDDYIKVWLNGQEIYKFSEFCRAVVQDDDIVEGVTLRKGWNTLLVKCVNIRATWGLMARFADEKNLPIETTSE